MILENKQIYLKYQLQFFAESGGGEKTEEPTAKKLKDAREEGQVAKSRELVIAADLLALFVTLRAFMGYLSERLISVFSNYYNRISTLVVDKPSIATSTKLLQDAYLNIFITILPLVAIAVLVAFVMNVFQVKWQPTLKPLKPKFSKLNPIKGFSRIFSKEKIFDLIRDIAKIAIIFYLAYTTLRGEADKLLILYELDLFPAVALIGDLTIDLGIKISGFYFIIGAADFLFQRYKHNKDLKMSKQEVKDEYKQQDGDPQIKGKRTQKMREASRRRMMKNVPQADVVITNPTHFACAIQYDKEKSKAPLLVAKGADYVAQKIKEIAKESDVPIVENKPLARMLYYNVEIEQEIPQELYQMTAEVLAYVYKLKNKI